MDRITEKNWVELVAEFHAERGEPINNISQKPLDRVQILRLKLIAEEFSELISHMHDCDRLGVLDSLCDLTYVVLGTVVAYGMQDVFDEAFKEVHRSNLSKSHKGINAGEKYGPDGKGKNYSPPDLISILNRYLNG
jgi:predicted HAD superfamily Cof-like phosphohydrolase